MSDEKALLIRDEKHILCSNFELTHAAQRMRGRVNDATRKRTLQQMQDLDVHNRWIEALLRNHSCVQHHG